MNYNNKMDKKQAVEIIDKAISHVIADRATHNTLKQAIETIKEALEKTR